MDFFENELILIKKNLREVLSDVGGNATLRVFGYEYRKKFGIINLQKFGLNRLSQLIGNLSDEFDLSFKMNDWWVSFNPKRVKSTKSDQQINTSDCKLPKESDDIMERFLADCAFYTSDDYYNKGEAASASGYSEYVGNNNAHCCDKIYVHLSKNGSTISEYCYELSNVETINDESEQEQHTEDIISDLLYKFQDWNPFCKEIESSLVVPPQPEIFLVSDESADGDGYFDEISSHDELKQGLLSDFEDDMSKETQSTNFKDFAQLKAASDDHYKYESVNQSADENDANSRISTEIFFSDNNKMYEKEFLKDFDKMFDENDFGNQVEFKKSEDSIALGINTEISFTKDEFASIANTLENYFLKSDNKIEEDKFGGKEAPENDHLDTLDTEIDAIEVFRDNGGVRSETNIPKTSLSSSSSFDKLSSLSNFKVNGQTFREAGELFMEDDEINEEMKFKSINDILASLPYDAPVRYSHFPPHNRNINLKLPELREENEKFFDKKIIYITEVNSPTHFWFQTKTVMDLWGNKMCKKIDERYKQFNKNDLRISSESLMKGLLVAVFIPRFQEWYRAKVNKIEKDNVQVFCIDFGSHLFINRKYLRYLLNEFTEYPKLCERGRLHGVMTYNDAPTFSLEHTSAFINKIFNKEIDAKLIKYHEKDEIFEMKLAIIEKNQDLAEWAIKKKICQIIPEEYSTENLPFCLSEITHKGLETGILPSYEFLLEKSEK